MSYHKSHFDAQQHNIAFVYLVEMNCYYAKDRSRFTLMTLCIWSRKTTEVVCNNIKNITFCA